MPSISNIPREYTEADKAQWILENGHPRYVWIFERVDEQIYRRPMAEPGTELPPWMPTEREPLDNKDLVDIIKEGNDNDRFRFDTTATDFGRSLAGKQGR